MSDDDVSGLTLSVIWLVVAIASFGAGMLTEQGIQEQRAQATVKLGLKPARAVPPVDRLNCTEAIRACSARARMEKVTAK